MNFHLRRFNPCFSGSCSRILMPFQPMQRTGFNPCFSGSCSRMNCSTWWYENRKSVSILVLVDLAHEFLQISCSHLFHCGFNPCFSGSCSRILTAAQLYKAMWSFNPCFSGSCSRMMPEWMTPETYCGFNPCFSGSCSRISQGGHVNGGTREFQSLF